MIIESGTVYRSIAGQNEFSFQINVENSNVSGISNIGFSGNNQRLNLFKFNSGQIFDFNDRYIWSYNPRDQINISGNIGSGYINYFINDTPVCLFSPRGNIYYDKFYVDTNNSILDLDLYIQGSIPEYELVYPNTVGVSQNVTGFIKNNSSPLQRSFEIFSGITYDVNLDYIFSQIYSGNISGGSSGIFILQPSINNEVNEPTLNTLDVILQTSFGNINTQLTYNIIPAPIYLTDFITGYTGLLGQVDNFTLQKFYNYELNSIYPINRRVDVILENFTGHTGQTIFSVFNGSGTVSGSVSKFIYGFDYITGSATGTGIAINDLDFYGKNPTGRISENFSVFQGATGFIDYRYNIPLFGASGTGFSPPGTVITGSGYINSGLFSGFIYGYNKLFTSGNSTITGFYINEDGTNIKTGINNFFILTGFTGVFSNDYQDFTWSANLFSGFSILGSNSYYGSGDTIIGVTGVRYFAITGFDNNGLYTFNTTVARNQNTGIYLQPLINLNSNLFITSGKALASENQDLSQFIFTGDSYFYFTGETGWAVFHFTGYSGTDKKQITHISFDLDKNVLYIPRNVSIQVSTNGVSWSNIYTGDFLNLNFYNNHTKYLSYNLNSFSNGFNSYQYARFLYTSRTGWQHYFTGDQELQKTIGIKNLQFYHGYNIQTISGEGLQYKLNYDTMTGYTQASGFNEKAYSGEVFYSNTSSLNPAWYAFNNDKINYPFAQLSSNDNYEMFIGYKPNDPLNRNLTGFKVEFVSGNNPEYYSMEYSLDGIDYYKAFVRTGNIQLVETGFFQIATGYQYFRINLSSKDPCVYSPVSGTPCYASVIDSIPECCSSSWGSGCQEAYEICTGLSYPFIVPPLYVPPPFVVSGWTVLFYTGNTSTNIQNHTISTGGNIITIQEPNNIYISTGSGISGTFILSNAAPIISAPFSQFKASADGSKLITKLGSPSNSNFTGVGRSWASMNFSVKTLGITSGEWSAISGLYNRVYYDERQFIGSTGQYKINDNTLVLSADTFEVSNNGQHIIFYKYNQYTFDPAIDGYDNSFNNPRSYWGFINNNTYLGLYDPYNESVPFSGIKIADNGFFAGLCGLDAFDQDFDIGPNKIFTGRLVSRSPMLNPVVVERADPFTNGNNNNAIVLLDISKLSGNCITVAAKNGRLISSRNSGTTWASGSGITTNFPWRKILVSDSGRHQSAVFGTGLVNLYSNNEFPAYSGYGIYTSSNSGISWSGITGGQLLIDYNISPNGKYVGFIDKNISSSSTLYVSSNYGIFGSFSGMKLNETGFPYGELDPQQLKISNNGIYSVKYNTYILNRQML